MKKLIVLSIALAALLTATGASAATYIVRLGVDSPGDDEGYLWEYNSIMQGDCGSHCLNWWTTSLPYIAAKVSAMICKDNTALYYWHDWDAVSDKAEENNPTTTSTSVTTNGYRVYSMTKTWDETQYYGWGDDQDHFARLDYKYLSTSPNRIRLFSVFPEIE